MGLSGDRETKGSSPRQGSLPGLPVGPGVVPNAVTMLVVQGITVLVALLLDGFGFPEEAIIIIFVLGVLLTAIATEGRAYSMAASLVALLTFNSFIVEPRYSLRAWGPS